MNDQQRPTEEDVAFPGDLETASTQAGMTGDEDRQPPGLWVLFITEMWERFSYYGMRALFVLFLIASADRFIPANDGTMVENTNPGFGWDKEDAYTLYGVYTFMVYLTSIFGGIAADRLLGTHRSMILGGWIIALGHIVIAAMYFFPHTLGQPVTMDHGQGALLCFLVGCALIIIGTGFFKPCVSVMVGQLYRENDPRRDSGFTIFYMGINLGAFFSPLVAGTLAEANGLGWHWGFGSAAVGMLFGLFFYQGFRKRYLGTIGEPPGIPLDKRAKTLVFGSMFLLVATPALPLILAVSGGLEPVVQAWAGFTGALGIYGMAGLITAIVVGACVAFLAVQNREERGPLAVILILAFVGNIFFWTAFEQAGSSLNVFAEENTNRDLAAIPAWLLIVIGAATAIPLYLRYARAKFRGATRSAIAWTMGAVGVAIASLGIWKLVAPGSFTATMGDIGTFPAQYYQSINPLAILCFAPVFAWLWLKLEHMHKDPSTPVKFSLGLWLLGLGFLAMVFGAIEARDGLAGPHYLLIAYVVVTWGELCLSPVGLSMVTKLAPKRLQSLMMGLWFFSFALSNLLAGLVARFSTKFVPGEDGSPAEMTFILEGLPGFFLMLVIFPIAAGFFIFAISPIIKKMMHGIR